MNPLAAAVHYLVIVVAMTCQELFMLLGPPLAMALVLQQLSQYVRRRAARVFGMNVYLWLTAPGVMLHELGHALFCVIFRHRIVRMSLFRPQPNGTLGYVEHSYNPRSTYQKVGNFFIGTGPVWLGSAVIYLLASWLLHASFGERHGSAVLPQDWAMSSGDLASAALSSAWRAFASIAQPSVLTGWRFWAFAFCAFCIGSHISLSRSDIQGASRGFLALVIVALLFNLATLWMGTGVNTQACRKLVQYSITLYAVGLFVLGVNLAVACVMFVIASLRR